MMTSKILTLATIKLRHILSLIHSHPCLGLQSFTKYLRLVFMRNSEIVTMSKGVISVFQEFFASINKIFILAGGLHTSYHSMKFRHFPDISLLIS